MSDSPNIEYLGHAGFKITYAGKRILIDPWFYPAFLKSWFPFPDNRFMAESVIGERFDYLYISHTHEDHFDQQLLEQLSRDIHVICPAFRSKGLLHKFKRLGFNRLTLLNHRESMSLAPGFDATMLMDMSHKEDSGLLLDMGGFRFLDLNDCNPLLSEIPSGIDLFAAQFSGAMWYPSCYDYPADVMRRKVQRVRADLVASVASKARVTGAPFFLPSAGPPCFLDPSLAQFNDRDQTIFPVWEQVEAEFIAAVPAIRIVSMQPGDRLNIDDGRPCIERYSAERPNSEFSVYSERRRAEWQAFYDGPERPVSQDEIVAYFSALQRRNQHLLHDFSKSVLLTAEGRAWTIRLGNLAQDFVIEAEEPYQAGVGFLMSNRVLRAVLDRKIGWEEALLSLRVSLHRDPDVFDSKLMGLLRYGNEPAKTLQMSREINSDQTIERDGLRMQRFCPHAGEDLAFATVCNGVIECPRHHWKWDAKTGECIEGGTLRLRVEPLHPQTIALVPELSACSDSSMACQIQSGER